MSPSTRRGPDRTDGTRLVAQAWLGSRILIAFACVFVAWRWSRGLEQVIGNWDVAHFVAIAQDGYADRQDVAFFPGLPLLLRGLASLGVPYIVSGIAISLVASIVAAVALRRLGGDRLGPWAAAAWLIAPTAVFTAVPYTESLFCALAFWAWERARAERWWQMALLAALACTVRVSGLFLVAALAVLIVTRTIKRRRGASAGRFGPLLWLALPVACLAAYMGYLYVLTGDWLAWYHAQAAGWSRGFTWPWQSFLNTVPAIVPGAYPDHPGWAWVFRAEVISMLVGIATTVVCLVRKRWAEATWVGAQVLAFSLSYWWMSVNRAVLLWFPVWILIAELGCWQPRGARARTAWRVVVVASVVGSCALVVGWSLLFFTGMWAS